MQVDLRNGLVVDPRTLKAYDSGEIRATRQEAIAKAAHVRQIAERAVAAACVAK